MHTVTCLKIEMSRLVDWAWFQPRTTDAQWSIFTSKSRTFGLGQTNWADKFWGIWGIFGQTISTHFGTVSPLSMFSIIQPLFLQKTKPLYPNPKYLFGIGIWIWAAKNSCARSLWFQQCILNCGWTNFCPSFIYSWSTCHILEQILLFGLLGQ